MINLVYLMVIIGSVFSKNDSIKVVVEDNIKVVPDTYLVQINFLKSKELEHLTEENKISKETALKLIGSIENINQIDSITANNVEGRIDLANLEEMIEFFDLIFLEVKGEMAFEKLQEIIRKNNLIGGVKDRTLEKLPDYEQQLIDKLINLSKQKAEVLAKEKGQKITKIVGYKELNRFEKQPRKEELIKEKKGEPTGFSILKEKFIEDNYNGYPIDWDGRIIIHKKIEVTWRTE